MAQANAIYLGSNLNRAIDRSVHHAETVEAWAAYVRVGYMEKVILDGREDKNPSANRVAPSGTYQLTKVDGHAPGDVDYWGYPV